METIALILQRTILESINKERVKRGYHGRIYHLVFFRLYSAGYFLFGAVLDN